MNTYTRRAMRYVMHRSTHYYGFYAFCETLRKVWRSITRKADLERLQQWAKRKKLPGLQGHYTRLLIAEEERLLFLRFRHPRIVFLVSLLHELIEQIKGEPAYYPKGSASKYRYQRVGGESTKKKA